jgi:hypothetical protein
MSSSGTFATTSSSHSSTPSAGQDPASEEACSGAADQGLVSLDASDSASAETGDILSPTANVGDVDVHLSDTADILPGAEHIATDVVNAGDILTGGGLISDLDVSHVLTGLTGGSEGLQAASSESGGGDCGDGGLITAVTDADVSAMVSELAGAHGNGPLVQVDLGDVGAILGGDTVADIASDLGVDGLACPTQLLDIVDTGGLLGDHA